MVDVVNGKTRVRAWPRKRGKGKSKKQQQAVEKFTQAQKAARYVDPLMMLDIVEARKGTPLLPRDVLTSMMFNTFTAMVGFDGKVQWPMQSRQKVSEALDTITQSPGATLRRGTDMWEGAGPSDTPAFSVLTDMTITAPTQYIESPDISALSELIVCMLYVTADAAVGRNIELRDSLSGAWTNTPNSVTYFEPTGISVNADGIGGVSQSATTARSFIMPLTLNDVSPAFIAYNNMRLRTYIPTLSMQRPDRVRVCARNAMPALASMTGGRVLILGR